MKIRVSEIPEEGIRIEGAESISEPFTDPTWKLSALSLFVEKEQFEVSVKGSIEASVPLACSRCVEPFSFLVRSELEVRYAPRPEQKDEVELSSDELEMDFYDHDLLDLATLVRAETLLALPMKPLCREGCRGVCSICGGNKNLTPCTCTVKLTDPRLEVLRSLAERFSPQ